MLDHLGMKLKKLDALGSRDSLTKHFDQGKVNRVKLGHPIDPDKLDAIRQAKAAGNTQKSVSGALAFSNPRWARCGIPSKVDTLH